MKRNDKRKLPPPQMIFWSYDQFPYVLSGVGYMRDDGFAYVPSYQGTFLPLKVMSLKDGNEFVKLLKGVTASRNAALNGIHSTAKLYLLAIAPWVKP